MKVSFHGIAHQKPAEEKSRGIFAFLTGKNIRNVNTPARQARDMGAKVQLLGHVAILTGSDVQAFDKFTPEQVNDTFEKLKRQISAPGMPSDPTLDRVRAIMNTDLDKVETIDHVAILEQHGWKMSGTDRHGNEMWRSNKHPNATLMVKDTGRSFVLTAGRSSAGLQPIQQLEWTLNNLASDKGIDKNLPDPVTQSLQ